MGSEMCIRDRQNISLDNIQKIEILKSPQGSVHGGQAAGGVIAITTDEGIFNGKKIRQKIKFGSNNSIYSGTYYSKGEKNVKLSLSANVSHSDGISSGNKNGLNTEKDAYNEGSLTFKSTLKNDENTNKVTFVLEIHLLNMNMITGTRQTIMILVKQIFNQV